MTWRKGLRWDAKVGRWRSVATGRLVSKVKAQAAAKPKPRPRPRPAAKPKPRSKPKPKPSRVPQSWRKGLVWDPDVGAWYVIATDRYLTEIGLQRRKTKAAPPKPKPRPRPKPKPRPRPKPKPKPRPKPKRIPLPVPEPKPKQKPTRAKPGWRKGIRWDKELSGWRNVKTGAIASGPRPGRKPRVFLQPDTKRVRLQVANPIGEQLDYAAQTLTDQGIPSLSDSFANRDGSVDGELLIRVKRGQNPDDVTLAIRRLFSALPAIEGTWISGGARFMPRDSEDSAEFWERYERIGGMAELTTYYSRNTNEEQKRMANLIGQGIIAENIRDAGYRKVENIVLRIHWNPDDLKPVVYRRKK